MSGTSADGIDAALIEFKHDKPHLIAHHSHAFSSAQKKTIRSLMLPSDNENDRMGVLDQQLGIEFADVAERQRN
jgi:1,6-anhydro-N-acetylmuramate kinase